MSGSNLKKLEVQLFVDTGNGFNEEDSVSIPYAKDRQKYEFSIYRFKNIKGFRLDPLNESCVISIGKTYIKDKNDANYKLKFLFSNADIFEKMLYFDSKDPQILFGYKQDDELEYLDLDKAVFGIVFYYINF